MSQLVKPEIQVGTRVRRLHHDHGDMRVGGISVVMKRIGETGVYLEADMKDDYEHDVEHLEAVDLVGVVIDPVATQKFVYATLVQADHLKYARFGTEKKYISCSVLEEHLNEREKEYKQDAKDIDMKVPQVVKNEIRLLRKLIRGNNND